MTKLVKYWMLLLCLLSINQATWGQSDSLYRPEFSIKYNPLAILAYTPGVELGIERMIGKETSLHLGGSYINDFNGASGSDFSGYKILSAFRFYSPFSKEPNNSFIALRFNFKKVIASGQTYLDRANGNYQELIDLTVDNSTLEFLGAIGKVYPINKWLSMDLSVVGGVKRLSLSSKDIPDDAFISITEPVLFVVTPTEPGNYWYPVFRLQVKFNFELK